MSKGTAVVKNNWGITLNQVTLRHRRGNDKDEQEYATWTNIPNEGTTGELSFTYETGPLSPFDYWWIKFVDSSNTAWQCKDDF